MFLALTDRFCDWHLVILDLFHAPPDWKDANGRRVHVPPGVDAQPSSIIENAFPELRNKQPFYELVWSELVASGLVENTSLGLHNRGEGPSLMKKRTTPFGDQFLAFISSPTAE